MPEALPPDAPLLRVLFVEDAPTDYNLLVRLLGVAGYNVQSMRVVSAPEFRDALKSATWDVILCDHDLPGFSSTAALGTLKDSGLDIPFIIVSGAIGEDMAAEAMLAGADDYVAKSRLTRLVPAIKRSVAAAASRREERFAKARLQLMASYLERIETVEADARDVKDNIHHVIAELANDVAWLRDHITGDNAQARLQNMQRALDQARARAERSEQALHRPPAPLE